jgi:hypothetical protein
MTSFCIVVAYMRLGHLPRGAADTSHFFVDLLQFQVNQLAPDDPLFEAFPEKIIPSGSPFGIETIEAIFPFFEP